MDGVCMLCKEDAESVEHALLRCPVVRPVWDFVKLLNGCEVLKYGSLLDVLHVVRGRGSREVAELWCVLLWSVWHNRNAALQGSKVRSASELVDWAGLVLSEFQATAHAASASSALASASRPALVWCPPPEGCLKLNTDAATFPSKARFGVGVSIRNHVGSVVAAEAHSMAGCVSPATGELLAVRAGLSFAKECGLNIHTVEMDAANAVLDLSSDSVNWGDNGFIIADIRELCCVVGVFQCQAIPRLGNRLAHCLASFALSSSEARQ